MGGSGNIVNFGGKSTNAGLGQGGNDSKKNIFRFWVIINSGNESDVWENCDINDAVYINNNTSSALPVLEVYKLSRKFFIGLVPPSSIMAILKLIGNGLCFSGTIIEKKGNEKAPQICVEVKGE